MPNIIYKKTIYYIVKLILSGWSLWTASTCIRCKNTTYYDSVSPRICAEEHCMDRSRNRNSSFKWALLVQPTWTTTSFNSIHFVSGKIVLLRLIQLIYFELFYDCVYLFRMCISWNKLLYWLLLTECIWACIFLLVIGKDSQHEKFEFF